jgi:hypothetical protein
MTQIRRALRRLRRDDDGQLIVLILGYTVIAGLLVTVVVNVSKTYLYRRSLVAAADAAALSAANQPDLDPVYRPPGDGPGPAAVPVSRPGATAAVARYAADAGLGRRFEGFRVVDVRTDGDRVTVTLHAAVRMPFLNLLSARYDEGYPVEAAATARSPLTP